MQRLPIYTISLIALSLLTLSLSAAQPTPFPIPDSPMWLNFPAEAGPGQGKHIILISAEQEYRSEQSMPMLAKILANHHGFNCTVLFNINDQGLVDPTMPVYPKKDKPDEFKSHNVPGLEHLLKADLVIFVTRLLTLPPDQLTHIVNYLDSGKPIIGLRTANHGFRSKLPYKINDQQINIGQILGGAFRGHHGNWHRDSTRGDIVPANKNHPILTGVKNIWGPSDVYRTYKEGESLPQDCTPLVLGQPLIGREQGGESNPKKIPLPVAWFKLWQTTQGQSARVFQSTMGSAKDLQNPGLRRLIINAAYWGMSMENEITANRSVNIIGNYTPLVSGFNYEQLGVIPQPPAAYRNE